MLLYRICLAKYANALQASGRKAKWNSDEVQVIYASSSRALACLENLVHRTQKGLNQVFRIITIEIPDQVKPQIVNLADLPADWQEYRQMYATQKTGDTWTAAAKSVLLQVPSSIITEECNFLINPLHPDFQQIKLIKIEEFAFDARIKR